MRVLLLSEFGSAITGGLERYVGSLARSLAAQGHEVGWATAAGSEPMNNVTSFPIRPWSRFLPHEDNERPFVPPIGDGGARKGLAEAIRRFEPDIVHAHGWLARNLPGDTQVPVVLTAHDYQIMCARRTLLHRGQDQCSGPSGRSCTACMIPDHGLVRGVALPALTAWARRTLRVEEILAVSEYVASMVRQHVDNVPVRIAYNSVEARFFQSYEPPRAGVVAYAGDPGAHKGFPPLLELWRSGTMGPHRLHAALTRMPAAGENASTGAGVSVSHVPAEQMPAFWGGATVAVVPSFWPDPCPTVALEAFAGGIPVVAARSGGLPEIVRDGVDGYLVAPGDSRQLAEALRRILDDASLRGRMAIAAKQRARRFTVESNVEVVLNSYASVIARRAVRDASRPTSLRRDGGN